MQKLVLVSPKDEETVNSYVLTGDLSPSSPGCQATIPVSFAVFISH